ncbi:hypothetical protein B0O99DRAFT_688031 [Bisporella sp. PMI_857]|nr:hypothetical protein B0O99DRAFT_688031 [Bisporella sp. PMI_857]
MGDNKYSYLPLGAAEDNIFSARVLILDPAVEFDATLHGTLEEVRLDNQFEEQWRQHRGRSCSAIPDRTLPPATFPPEEDPGQQWKYYEAVSYTWGDPSDRNFGNLFIDGYQLPTSKILFEALRRFRLLSPRVLIWLSEDTLEQDGYLSFLFFE